jgi:hypothetical protein
LESDTDHHNHGVTHFSFSVDGEKRRLMIAALRYYDTLVKIDGSWIFADQLLYVDWLEERPL